MAGMRVLLFLPVLLLLWHGAPAHGLAGQPVRVTTDSVEYCRQLANRTAGFPQPRPVGEAREVEQARRLCESGHPRSGIARLRRLLRAAQTPG